MWTCCCRNCWWFSLTVSFSSCRHGAWWRYGQIFGFLSANANVFVWKCKSFGLDTFALWGCPGWWGSRPLWVFFLKGLVLFVQVHAELALLALVALCGTCPGCSCQHTSQFSFSSDLHPFSLSAEKVSFALRRRTTPSVVDFAYWKLPPSLLVIALVNSPYGQYSCTLSEEVPCSINNCAFYLLLLVRIWMPCNNDLVKVQTPDQIWITHTAVLQSKLQTKCLHDLLEGGDFFAGKPQPTST